MKIILFGLGSIGQRHVRAIKSLYPESVIYRFRRENSYESIPGYESVRNLRSWAEIEHSTLDFAVISNPTPHHIGVALECSTRNIPFFLEKPISVGMDGLPDLLASVRSRDLVTYVAYPLRFHPVIQTMKAKYGGKGGLTARVKCWTDASKWPSKRILDHVILELSHEIDYAEHIFGEIKGIEGGGNGKWVSLVLKHDRDNESWVSLWLNSAIEVREVSVREKGVIEKHQINKTDRMYVDQMRYFVDNLKNPRMENNLPDASRLFEKIIKFKGGLNEATYNHRGAGGVEGTPG